MISKESLMTFNYVHRFAAALFLALALMASLVFAPLASAQHKHGAAGPNGGLMEDVAGIHAELVAKGNEIVVYVFDESEKPLKAAGITASALVVNGNDRETIKLEATDTSLKGTTKKAVARNTQVTVMIKTAQGKSGQARFKIEK